ncbi:MAG TPA: type II toxin-antitoxin system VapC family toxin [Candidatus Sulfotelmatobacter sp.]|nr:type II toxin-antitoxin system VapC family toxin [Candidatus Sulfotelmatobacter sp.]
MRSFVLDASVAAKWMLPAKDELLRTEAFRLLDAYEAGEINLVVPDIFWPECGNLLWKAVRQNRCPRADAELALLLLVRRKIPTLPSSEVLSQALSIAVNFNRPVYDSLYVALAAVTKNDLITADERLANALAARFPIKWLGAI